MTTVTSSATISKLKVLFAQFGLPDTIVSDNGASLITTEFESYLTQHGIRHITLSPYHPVSNGLAERAVQLVKNGLKKDTDGTLRDWHVFFLIIGLSLIIQLVFHRQNKCLVVLLSQRLTISPLE